MTAELTWFSRFRIDLGFVSGFLNTALDTIRGDGLDSEVTLNSGSTPDVDDGAMLRVAMTAGAASINLAAIVDALTGLTKNATGKKVRGIKIMTTGNAAVITIAKGASNGYTGFGAAFSVTLPTNSEMVVLFGADITTVASGDRTLDLAGTGTDGIDIGLVWGGT